MSELKAFELKVGKNLETDSPLVVGVDNKWNSRIMSGEEVYLKSEADKAIADLEMKLARAQLVLRLNKPEALYSNLETMGRLNHKIDVVERRERHQKYKRCLAMAKIAQDDWHLHNSFYAMGHQEFEKRKCKFYEKWHKRWLELAEHYKENKCLKKAEEFK